MANTKTSKIKDTIVRRLYARGKWKLDSVAHFGGDETGIADMCLLRDAEGTPFIPAASIAGAARSFLARLSKPWMKYQKGDEGEVLKRLFGGAGENDTMSALIVADAACKNSQTSIRDGVRVDTQSGSAADGAKFDVEVVERETEFELRLECVIRDGDDNKALEKLFLVLLHGFETGDIRLGARTRRGYGRGKVASWKVRDLNMDDPEDVMAWLRDKVWCRPASQLTPCPLRSDKRQYFRLEADFILQTSLLIRSSPSDPKAPDMVHLHSAGEPVVPGTSFAGAFRHRASLIANTIGWPEDAVSEIFGPVHEQGAKDPQKDLWASRVWIEEKLVKNVESRWQDRVAIDRFTGGSLQSALFNEKPIFPQKSTPHLKLKLMLEEPDDAEIGLLFLTLRDFWYGYAALGGETSNGRGTLQGFKAELQLKRRNSSKAEWEFSQCDSGMTLVGCSGDASFLECCVKKAQSPPEHPDGSRWPEKQKGTIDD
ncbi:MAG: hypothetical protein J4F29_14685 [Candidatus Latescibacteria bacterium]|nr:hypothetical protein [Candidatus Latescibacterota bacterium]